MAEGPTGPVFTNPKNLQGCQDCPVARGACAPHEAEAAGCCGARSGVYATGYESGAFRYERGKTRVPAFPELGLKHAITKSQRWWTHALDVIPAGSQTFSKAPGCFVDGVSPKFLQRGKGARVWDVDGNQFIDYCMGCFSVTLGHGFPAVDDAIRAQLSDGINLSLMHPLEVEVADRLRRLIPSAEMVRYGKNGSDATMAAERLARFVTGREKVACLGYHGIGDWYIGTTDRSYGVPASVQALTMPFKYNHVASLEALVAAHRGQIACVIMEPALFEFPKPGFLEQVRELTRAQGALLIFDELLTGFRFAAGGAQELLGVTPDLTTLGKGVANGMPIGVVAGRAEYMRHFDKVFFSTTYGGEALTLAAAAAALDTYLEGGVIPRLWKSGKIIFDNFTRLIEQRGLTARMRLIGYPVRQQIVFRDRQGQPSYELSGLFQQEMAKRGILSYAGLGFSAMHTDDELMYTVAAFDATLDVLAKAVEVDDPGRFLEGRPPEPVFRALRDKAQTSN